MKCRILIVVLGLFCAVSLLSACEAKTPITASTFIEVMENKGFTVTEDVERELDVVFDVEKGDIFFTFVVCSSDQKAKIVFDTVQNIVDGTKGNSSFKNEIKKGAYFR